MLINLKTALEIAKKRNCAIPAFNVYNAETAIGALQAAEEADSVVILQMYSRLFMSVETEFLAPALVAAAQRSKAKVCFHLDHGACDEAAFRAVRWGCTGVMRDASALPFEENVAVTKNIVDICHAVDISVEGELGHIGMAKEGVSTEYTKVDEAVRYVNETGVDALAILVGTAHGHYKQAPVIAIDRIKEIAAATDAALVLHGGSGVPDDQIVSAIKAGIRKINFGTDVCYALLDGIFDTSRDLIAVDVFMKKPTECVKQFCLSKIKLLGSEGSNECC